MLPSEYLKLISAIACVNKYGLYPFYSYFNNNFWEANKMPDLISRLYIKGNTNEYLIYFI